MRPLLCHDGLPVSLTMQRSILYLLVQIHDYIDNLTHYFVMDSINRSNDCNASAVKVN